MLKHWFEAVLRLTRYRLSLFVALSAAAGFSAAAMRLTWGILLPSFACVLLAGGASALNQIQERKLDGRMSRTRSRPIPSGRITPNQAVAISLVLIGAAFVVLALWCGPWAFLFGVSALGLYNGIYTRMKRWTAFAAVPGAAIGALGPAIGWVAAAGPIRSPTLLALAMVFFLWQVPHFWLLNLSFPRDYGKAGYPSAVDCLGQDRLFRMAVVWMTSTALATLSLPLFGLLTGSSVYLVLSAATVLLSGLLLRMVIRPALGTMRYRMSFAGINMFVLVTMILLIVESGM